MNPPQKLPKPDSLLSDLRSTLAKMTAKAKTNDDRLKQGQLNATISLTQKEQSFSSEIKNLRTELNRKSSELIEAKRRLDEQEHDISSNYKRQFRHLSDTLTEKQAEIQYLNKQANNLKNRVSSLEHDLKQSNSAKKSLELSLTKTVELIKSQFKELFDCKQDQELNRFMSETNFKQINDKIEALLNICVDLENKKSFMEDKYCMLKKENTQQIDNNIKLEVELEKLKEQLWQEKQIIQSYKNNKQFALEEVQFFAKKSKSSRVSQMHSQQEKVHQKSNSSRQKKMDQTISLLKAETNMLLNLEEKLILLNKKINHDTDIWRQVLTVKQHNSSLQLQLNELKAKINPEHQDLLLQQKHPNLYQFFIEKVSQIKNFEKRLEQIQNDAHKVTQTLDNMLYNGVAQKQVKPNENEILEKEKAVRSKIKKEMLQIFENQKQMLMKDVQQLHQSQIQAFKDKITDLSHEVARLQDKNENLFKMLEESEKLNRRKTQVEEKPQKLEVQELTVIEKVQGKIDTQSIIGADLSQISHINFLEEKAERLEEQLKECNTKIDLYKKEIRHMLEAYKVKNTKYKFIRCHECLIRIGDNDNFDTKCQKCRLDIHGGQCLRIHEKNCKKNITNNKPKAKKPEPKSAASMYSQNIDYF